MQLYYSPGTCALAPHVVAAEAGLPLELIKVDLASKQTEQGLDYLGINPHGYVPLLVLDDGRTLGEASVIVQYLADQKPDSRLLPPAGRLERYQAQQWLNFIATELHKGFSPLFKPDTPEETRTASHAHLARRIGYVDDQLASRTFVTGDTFTAADAYLWTILRWAPHVGVDLSGFSHVRRFQDAVAARPAAQQALREEGLI